MEREPVHDNYVCNAIRSLQSGKSDGVDDIYSDNLKNASHHFMECIMYLFNSILSYGCIPERDDTLHKYINKYDVNNKFLLFATVLPLTKKNQD